LILIAYFTWFLKSRKIDFDRPELNGLKSEFWQGKRWLARTHLFFYASPVYAPMPVNLTPLLDTSPESKTTVDGSRSDICSTQAARAAHDLQAAGIDQSGVRPPAGLERREAEALGVRLRVAQNLVAAFALPETTGRSRNRVWGIF
jgi:hypothetical protein